MSSLPTSPRAAPVSPPPASPRLSSGSPPQASKLRYTAYAPPALPAQRLHRPGSALSRTSSEASAPSQRRTAAEALEQTLTPGELALGAGAGELLEMRTFPESASVPMPALDTIMTPTRAMRQLVLFLEFVPKADALITQRHSRGAATLLLWTRRFLRIRHPRRRLRPTAPNLSSIFRRRGMRSRVSHRADGASSPSMQQCDACRACASPSL
jgi:hypothetical protein